MPNESLDISEDLSDFEESSASEAYTEVQVVVVLLTCSRLQLNEKRGNRFPILKLKKKW